ncbi:phage tail protein [Salmonella enterica]|nr:phage tail protein [Salmonella enterica]ELH8558501.1 phage tail protein [Salmonella enterica]
MATKYYALLTNVGAAKLANATALGEQVEITQMAVGDGNGALPTPNPAQTALVHELRRASLNTLTIDPVNTNQIIAEQVIPGDVGGWWIREIGLYDSKGDLIAIANCAETYKPLLQEGSGRMQVIRVILIVSSTQAVTLKIDPSVVLATRQYVDDQIIQVKAFVDQQLAAHIAAADPHKQYAPKASPALTGTPTAPTATAGNNSTQLANTAFVQAALVAVIGGAPTTLDTLKEIATAINNDPNFSATINNALALKAPLASPAMTGTPTAPTAAQTVNNTQIATTEFVKSAIAALVASSPAALDTLNELAAALGNDPNFATTVTNTLAGKQPLDSTLTDLSGKTVNGILQYLGLNETLNPSKRVSIGALGTGVFDGSKPAINIGDSDSGFVFESDGVIGVYANSQKIAELTNTEFKIIGNLSLTNGALLLGGLTHFLRHTAADDAGFAGNNVELASWNGIGLTCTYDNITRIYFNPRTGEIGLRGDLKADGNVRSGNAWLDQTGNLQGSAWGAGVGLKAYLDNTFNRKNTASLDTNGWHRDESTGLITQWGLIDQANGTYNFPRAFPNQCFVVLVTNTNAQGSGVDNAFGYPISNSQFVAGSKNNGGGIGPYPVAFKALGR